LSESDFRDFLPLLAPAVRRAAQIARWLEGRVPNQPKLGEATAVKRALTAADTAAQEALLVPLLEHFPQVHLLAEEDTPSVEHFAEKGEATVVIDPIDGTLHSYLEGGGPYAVMIGLALGGQYQAGLVALPREELLLQAWRGAGASMARADHPPQEVRPEADGDLVLVSHGTPRPVIDSLTRRGLRVVSSCGGAVSVAPLIPGVRAGLRHAEGEFGVSIRGRIGALIAAEAGALVRGASGASFPLDLDTPASTLLVAAQPEDLSLLDEALAAGNLA
jgi:fructose-1,6-bisphosphatase/inositol monophosphatase family enzyme